MGSLMAGWASPVLDEHKVQARRNKSLTREEIEEFRKLQRKNSMEEEDQEEGRPVQLSPTFTSQRKSQDALAPKKSVHLVHNDQLEELEGSKPDKTGDWWTRSNWAFLNEPPRDETDESAHKYTAQFHVAQLATGDA